MTTTSPSEPSKGAKLVARLSKIVTSIAEGRAKGKAIAKELRAIADELVGEVEPPKQKPSLEVATAEERQVFDYWQRVMGKPQAKPTKDRLAKIRARLNEGYSVGDIKRAIDGCAQSGYHRGENDSGTEYNDLTLICRTGAKLEAFREKSGAAPTQTKDSSPSATTVEVAIEQLQRKALEQLKANNHDAYNNTQTEIARIRAGGVRGATGGPAPAKRAAGGA